MTNNDIVQKLWNLCDVLRDDGINYSDYVTELVLLLFIKMVHENTEAGTLKKHPLPEGCRWTDINGLPAVSVFENPFYGVDGLIKRAFDVVLSSLLLIVLALPMAVIALLVKRSSPGPVFFRQLRYGLDGRSILVWKFRSMGVCENGASVTQATKNDPRVTKIGAILRRTSLDEIPQLINVLSGSMSLVGPRPHANAHNEHYRSLIPGYMLRHKVKPGITGWAQVNGWRGETDTLEKMEKRVECDHEYIRQWSLAMDMEILFRTFWVVFSRKNAY
jgi:putative colanic acid biosynthesis UDP-glucose lipid carrier transferase